MNFHLPRRPLSAADREFVAGLDPSSVTGLEAGRLRYLAQVDPSATTEIDTLLADYQAREVERVAEAAAARVARFAPLTAEQRTERAEEGRAAYERGADRARQMSNTGLRP